MQLILLIFFSFFIPLHGQKFNSLFWKISKNGKPCGHLYGTMHVSNKSAFRFNDEFLRSLESTDIVALETDPSIWLPNMLKTGMLSSEREVFSVINPGNEFYKNFFTIPFPNNYIYINALQFEPDIINGLLFRNNKDRLDYQEATYVDLFIYQAAKKFNKPVVSLEDFESSEIYSRLAKLPDDEFDTVPNPEPFYGENKIEEYYKDGNLDAIDSLFQQMESKNFIRYLLFERNKIFVRSLDSLIKTGKTVFAAMGAAHLPGENGVITALRKFGYTVEPIRMNNSQNATNKVREVEQILYKSPLKNTYVFDSIISLKSPDIFYPLFHYDNMSNSVSPDIVNGAYVSALRIKTYAFHLGLNNEKIFQKIDSLIYEGIGGKISDKKSMKINDELYAFDITSKLQNGNILHTKIFITPTDVFIIKLNSTENYYKQLGKSIMESVRCNYKKTPSDIYFIPKTGGFKIAQLSYTSYFKNHKVASGGIFEVYESFSTDKGLLIGLMRGNYPSVPDPEIDTLEYRKFYEGIRQQWPATDTSGTFKIVDFQKKTSAYFRFRTPYQNILSGFIFKYNTQYILVYFIDKFIKNYNTKELNRFFNFEPDRFQYSFRTIKDDDFHFLVTDEVSGSEEDRFNEKYKKYYQHFKKDSPREIMDKRKRKTYSIQNKTYYSPSSMHYISVVYEEYSPYEGIKPYELKNRILDIYHKNYSCHIITLRYDSVRFSPFLHVALTDTGTSEQLHIKIFVKGSRVYQLKYLVDTLAPENEWKKKFTETFIPSDTLPTPEIFTSKFDELTADLMSGDTAKYHNALHALENDVVLSGSNAGKWKKFISSSFFNSLSTIAKEKIITCAYQFPSHILISELPPLYRKLTDSSYLQLAILRCLSNNKSAAAISTMNNLLLEEVPISGNTEQIESVFYNLLDSLPMVKNLMPALKKLIQIDEYRKISVGLMALMLEHKIIHPKDYADILPQLLTYGKIELKKYFASSFLKSKNFYKFLKEKNTDENTAQFLDLICEERFEAEGKTFRYDLLENKLKKREIFLNYFILLTPHAYKQNDAEMFIRKVLKIQTYDVFVITRMWALKHKLISPDSIKFLWEGHHLLNWYVHYLGQKWEISNLNIQKSNLISLTQNLTLCYLKKSASYSYENNYLKDSLILHKILPVSIKSKKGHIYVFKSSPDNFGRYTWHYTYIPSDEKMKNTIQYWKVYLTNYKFKTFKKDHEIERVFVDDFESIFLPKYYIN